MSGHKWAKRLFAVDRCSAMIRHEAFVSLISLSHEQTNGPSCLPGWLACLTAYLFPYPMRQGHPSWFMESKTHSLKKEREREREGETGERGEFIYSALPILSLSLLFSLSRHILLSPHVEYCVTLNERTFVTEYCEKLRTDGRSRKTWPSENFKGGLKQREAKKKEKVTLPMDVH